MRVSNTSAGLVAGAAVEFGVNTCTDSVPIGGEYMELRAAREARFMDVLLNGEPPACHLAGDMGAFCIIRALSDRPQLPCR
jgi:hypothetical protein